MTSAREQGILDQISNNRGWFFGRKWKDEKGGKRNLIRRLTREEAVKDFMISINDLSEMLLNDQEGIRLLGVSQCLSVLAHWTTVSLPRAFLSEGIWWYICYNLVLQGWREISCPIQSHRSHPDVIHMLYKCRFVEECLVSWIHNSTRVQKKWWPHVWMTGFCRCFNLVIAKVVERMEMVYVWWNGEVLTVSTK